MEPETLVDRRAYPRVSATVSVIMRHDSCGSVLLYTRDFSENGVFLLAADPGIMPSVGTIVELHVGETSTDTLPQRAVIVRKEKDGIGLRFC